MSASFDKFAVGYKRSFTHQVTAEDVRRFVELSGDDNPVHVDRAFAARTPMRRPVVHGMLTAAFVSRLVGKYVPGDGALWVSQSFEFHQPAHVGDTLLIEAEVTQRSESQRLLVIAVRVANQAQQPVLSGEGKVQLLEFAGDTPVADKIALPKVALVTGASRGIGAACAQMLARKGYAVLVNYSSDADGAEQVVAAIAAQQGRAAAIRADVRDEAAVVRMIAEARQRFGGLGVVVNNAGGALRLKSAHELTWADFSENIDLYLRGAFLTARAALPFFREQGGGSIINIGTIATDSRPPGRFTAYAVAKEAVWALTKNLAAEWGVHGIRVNQISAGLTETALVAEIPAKARLLAKLEAPLRRLTRPEDVAQAVAFLAGEEAVHITGENLRICGGTVML